MANDYPEIRDVSSVTGVFNNSDFLVVGIEGQADNAGTATAAIPVVVTTPAEADTYFGPSSSLAALAKFVLNKGVGYVVAVASLKGSAPNLTQRRAAWATLEDNPNVRIRLTDSTTQADLVALADSCEWAEGVQNKQVCFVGMASGTTKSGFTAAATAIASKRAVLVGPAVYDADNALLSGAYAAAWVASMVALNGDIADDLDTAPLPGSLGIEKESATGMPLFRLRANAGSPTNDFQDLLTGGVSPLRQGRNGGAEIAHLRTTYTTDTTFDALMTLLVKDQAFLRLRTVLEDAKFLRRGNTLENRSLAAQIVDNELQQMRTMIEQKKLPDGTIGYGVTVTASSDERKMIVSYQGKIVRNTQVIDINGVLTISV
jgi:phage tail sheath gpL-like